ncbi:MAG: hypothetical protein OXK79_04360 [Chloroflexota bacterium]|nr:hypothetical protein [Chloroflexota bacterium]
MDYEIRIEGVSPIIMRNGASGLDTRSPARLEMAEISRKRGSNRTVSDEARLAELDCQVSLWLDEDGAPTIPEGAVRAMMEESARKLKQGPQVREGLIVTDSKFEYDTEQYGTSIEELGRTCQFTVPVVVQRQRILRTRAKFDEWACVFTVDADPELVDAEQLAAWLDIGGRRIGLGDWRPSKSGHYGRFTTTAITPLE